MSACLVSVLITAYNYGRFIEESIDSVLAQDFPRDQVEILIVDDGSTDDTAERVKKYGSSITYLHKENGGQASALNHGLERAGGEIVALLDADDLFLPGKIAYLADIFARDPSLGMVYHKLQEWHAETGLRREWPFVEISGDIRSDPKRISLFLPQPTSGVAFRRSLLKPLLPIPEQIRMLADCFLVSLMPFVAPVRALPSLFTVYRIHGKNAYTAREPEMSRDDKAKKFVMWKILVDAMVDWLTKSGQMRKNRAARVFRSRWQDSVEGLRTDPPGRFRFFLAVLRQNHAYAPLQTWRLTFFNYLFAPWALILGSKRSKRFYEWRGAVMAGAQRASNSVLGMSRDSK